MDGENSCGWNRGEAAHSAARKVCDDAQAEIKAPPPVAESDNHTSNQCFIQLICITIHRISDRMFDIL